MQRNTQTQARRFGRGFTQTGSLLSSRLQKATSARGFSQMRLLTHWEEIVGAEIARIAQPLKVSYGRQGLGARLTVLARPAHAPELQMQLPRLKERVNASYGYTAISDIRITQTGEAVGFAEPKSSFEHDAPRPSLSPQKAQKLDDMVSNVEDETLRALLQSLGENILLTPKGTQK